MTNKEIIDQLEQEKILLQNSINYLRQYSDNLFVSLWLVVNQYCQGMANLDNGDLLNFDKEACLLSFFRDSKNTNVYIEAKHGRKQNVPSKS